MVRVNRYDGAMSDVTNPITLRSPGEGEVGAFLAPAAIAFGEAVSDDQLAHDVRHLERDRAVGAFDGDQQVGCAAAYTFRVTVPGGEVGAAGITAVAVLPTHTRRGILRQMMTWLVAQARERGEPLAILGASQAAIYQRFGFGIASLRSEFEVEPHRVTFSRPVETTGQFRFVDADEATRLFPVVYDSMRQRTPGALDRGETSWRWGMVHDAEWMRQGSGPKFLALLEIDGQPRAYAIYRIKADWDHRGPRNAMRALEVIGVDAADEQAMWQWLFRVDLVASVKAHRGPTPHPMLLQITEPRGLGLNVADEMWLRILDVAPALQGRTYRGSGSLTVELADAFCPWNAGTWQLTVSGHEAAATVIPAKPRATVDLALDISALSTIYLGGFTFAELARAGRVSELREGGLAAADALFATSIKPWNSTPF